ncbi:cytochrome P450 [Rhodococcus koreensis]|uniref:cytochrome P450 n=1 Tax=Rhodococcus koreensis TaxID=99653 RepID=UPI0036DC310F
MSVTNDELRSEAPYAHEIDWPNGLGEFSIFDDDGSMAEPFEHYKYMRAHAPVLRVRYDGGEFWHLARYEDVRKASRTPKVFGSQLEDPVPVTFLPLFDAPDHTRLRGAVAGAFNPKSIALVEDRVRDCADSLLGTYVDAGGGDITEQVATPLTMTTIAAILDIPADNIDQLRHWSSMLLSVHRRSRGLPGTESDRETTAVFLDFIEENLERLYRDESPSVGGHLARQWKSGGLAAKEAREMCAFLFVAGHDTTTFLIGNAVRQLTESPELLDRINSRPADAELFVEELARTRGTVHRTTRQTRTDVEMSGVTIPAGSMVRLLIASANRDESKFANPDIFDIDRNNEGHFGFGFGVHSCIGAPLARLETRIAVQCMARKIARITLDPDNPMEMASGSGLTVGPRHLYGLVERRHR